MILPANDLWSWEDSSAAIVAVDACERSVAPTAIPPKREVKRAAIGRTMAKAGPRSDQVADMESTPVCGVAIRKDVDAALEAPPRCIAMAVGRTPQEQRGNGMPNRAALTTGRMPLPDKWRDIVAVDMKACIRPAMRNPSRIYGAIWQSMISMELKYTMVNMFCFVVQSYESCRGMALYNFAERLYNLMGENDTVNDTVKRLNGLLKKVYAAITDKPGITHSEIMAIFNISESTAKRATKELKRTGLIKREGSDKTGKWIIIK